MTENRKDDEIEYLRVVVDADKLRTIEIDGERTITFDQKDIEVMEPAPIKEIIDADQDATVSRFDSYDAKIDPEWKRTAILNSLAAPSIGEQVKENIRGTLSDS